MEVQEIVVVGTQVTTMASLVEKETDMCRSREKRGRKNIFSLVCALNLGPCGPIP